MATSVFEFSADNPHKLLIPDDDTDIIVYWNRHTEQVRDGGAAYTNQRYLWEGDKPYPMPEIEGFGIYGNNADTGNIFHVHLAGDGTAFAGKNVDEGKAGAYHLKVGGKYKRPSVEQIMQVTLLDHKYCTGIQWFKDEFTKLLMKKNEEGLNYMLERQQADPSLAFANDAERRRLEEHNKEEFRKRLHPKFDTDRFLCSGNWAKLVKGPPENEWKNMKLAHNDSELFLPIGPADDGTRGPTPLVFWIRLLCESKRAVEAILRDDPASFENKYKYFESLPTKAKLLDLVNIKMDRKR